MTGAKSGQTAPANSMTLSVLTTERFYRFAAAASALLVFFALSLLYLCGDRSFYFTLLENWGIDPFRFPFLDMSGALAAWECARHGIDVIVSDPCDVLQRSYNYSPIWMSWSAIPLGIADTPAVGWICGLLFLLSLGMLPSPRRPLELILTILATLSAAVVFAVERGNPDILLFILAVVTALSAEGGLAIRLIGYAVALLSALVKYYPLVTLMMLVDERVPVFLFVSVAVILSLTIFGVAYHEEIARTLPYLPHGGYIEGFFGAKNLPFQIGDIAAAAFGPAAALGNISAAACLAVLGAGVVATCRGFTGKGRLPAAMATLDPRERNLLVLGSAVMCSCFFLGQNIWYRAIFLLMVLPGLFAISRAATSPRGNHWSLGTGVAIVFLMWEEFFRFGMLRVLHAVGAPASQIAGGHLLFWILREAVWWWVIAILLAIMVEFLRRSAVVCEVMSWLRRSSARPAVRLSGK
jgi:hypothetical protein